MKDEFLATVSHELRTPLTAILGWTRMLRARQARSRQVAHGPGDHRAQRARPGAAHRRHPRRLAHHHRQAAPRASTPVDLAAVVRGGASTRCGPRPTPRASSSSGDIGPARPSAVSGDPDRLQQVVWNLLSNAIKFTPAAADRSRSRARAQIDSHVEIRVTDTGQGIAPDFLPHVFDRFRQADGTSTRAHGGLGLGLAIVRHLVELHGGTVHAESDGEGKGPRSPCDLPVRAVQVADASADRRRPPPSRSSDADAISRFSAAVLVVDDEPDARELIATVLEQAGARAITVSQREEAALPLSSAIAPTCCSATSACPPDGYSLMRTRSRAPRTIRGAIPAAALTAYSRAEDARRAIEAGFQRHVAKPVEPEVLVAQVAALAGRNPENPPPRGADVIAGQRLVLGSRPKPVRGVTRGLRPPPLPSSCVSPPPPLSPAPPSSPSLPPPLPPLLPLPPPPLPPTPPPSTSPPSPSPPILPSSAPH